MGIGGGWEDEGGFRRRTIEVSVHGKRCKISLWNTLYVLQRYSNRPDDCSVSVVTSVLETGR